MPETSSKYLDPAVLSSIHNLGLRAQRVVEGTISGLHRSPLHGVSVEFASYREYAPGDDLRRLDWRAYARSNRHFVKQYEEESNLRGTILLDASASMKYGEGPMTKYDYAATVAASLASLCVHQRDAVALAVFDNAERVFLRAAATQAQLAKIIDVLDRSKPERESDLGGVLSQVCDKIKRRGVVIVISDLLVDLDSFYKSLGRLQHNGHEILVFQILDDDEIELPFGDSVLFKDIEGDETLFAEPWAFRKAYKAAMEQFIEETGRRCRSAGIDHLLMKTSDNLGLALSHYLHGREVVGLRRGGKIEPMSFLAPMLMWGTLLASVPIIIHLLNRRRFRLVDWAPMKYLKLTLKTNRRRMRIEQFILLAVRALAVITLFLALARPLACSSSTASWLGGHGRAARVLVIDDSLSMGYRADGAQGGRSAFDSAKEAATQLVKSIGPQDSVTILTTSAPESPVLRDAHLDDSSKAVSAIAMLQPSDARGDWPTLFKAITQHLDAAPFPAKEVVLITDLRREGWNSDVTEIANRWAGQSVDVKIIDVGSRQTTNLTLLGFDQQDPVALPGAPVNLMATIRNDEPTPLASGQAVLTIGGEQRPIILPDLAPGSTTRVPLSVTRQEPGQHPINLKLPGDALPGDDGRWLNLTVRPNLQVTLVDGEPGARPFEGETDFLALSFTVGNVPWRVTRQTDSEWLASRAGEADVIALANLASISPERVTALEQLVKDGTGLMIFAGEQIDPQLYNDRLFKNGNGLLPVRLEKASDEPVTGMVVEQLDDSPLAALSKIDPGALARVVAKRFMLVEPPAGKSEQVRVLARWNDPQGRPAVIERKFGKGRVLLWTVTADRQWTDWPVDPTYVLAVRSAALAVARPDGQEHQVNAGEPIRHRLADGEQAADPRVLSPGAAEPEVAAVEKTAAGNAIVHPRTARSGVYALKWKDATNAQRSHLIAANPNRLESDLRPLSEPELADLMGSLDAPVIHYTGGETSLTQRREIWKTFAMILLTLAAVETVLAVWVGRER